jgi:diamine N-acetyltransferase
MLVGKFARLRIMDSTDGEYVRALRNSPHVMRRFHYRYFISDLQQREFVQDASRRRTQIIFIAERIDDGKPFGVYDIKEIDYRNQHGEWGVFLEERDLGDGVPAFEAAVLLLDYAFGYLNLHKLAGELLADNQRAIRFDQGLGMQLEGVRKQHVFYDGRFHDLLQYALFREDFYGNPTPAVAALLAEIRSRHAEGPIQPERE